MHVPILNLEVRGYEMHYANIKQVVSSPQFHKYIYLNLLYIIHNC